MDAFGPTFICEAVQCSISWPSEAQHFCWVLEILYFSLLGKTFWTGQQEKEKNVDKKVIRWKKIIRKFCKNRNNRGIKPLIYLFCS